MPFGSDEQRKAVWANRNKSHRVSSNSIRHSSVHSHEKSSNKMLRQGKSYPEEITWGRLERYYANSKTREFENVEKAREYAKKIDGQVYTLYAGDGDTIWSRGFRIVNSAHRWLVIKTDKGLVVDNS